MIQPTSSSWSAVVTASIATGEVLVRMVVLVVMLISDKKRVHTDDGAGTKESIYGSGTELD